MTSVLVTGGAGYIGSHACKALAEAGFKPVTVDNLSTGHEWAVKWGPLEVGDIRDGAFLMRVFDTWKPRSVIHFAGLALVGESAMRPDLYFGNNVAGTLSLLDAMRGKGIGRIVFSSSCTVYGHPARVPLDESLPYDPISPYGASKAMAERLLQDYAAAFAMRAVALRYFNAAGADAGAGIGEAHDPETHLIPLAIAAALRKGSPLPLFGTDYPTPDGTCIRDYIHVGDLAVAHLKSLAWMDANPGFAAFNLGNGAGSSVRQVIDAVERISGLKVPCETAPRRMGDSPVLVADSGKARQFLGWSPAIAGLDEIVASAWAWHRSKL
ncbi:MAG: UDP-glucose 4-epimerase GalE [Rhodospirillales bacterium]|nr:MAG: UDP-glucose 4-epimerase GalE [Rhodospirillales bacterium]